MDLRESYLRDGVKQRPESLYDDLVTRLFKEGSIRPNAITLFSRGAEKPIATSPSMTQSSARSVTSMLGGER
jgi:hypothetical protein